MSWRDRVQAGSFRGASFLVESHDAEGGRRVELHEYPLRDTPWAEDLGRKAGRWNLELFVLGSDYMSARDALKTALDAPGAGTLVHPWLGSLSVLVDSWRLRETTREGGMARFSVTFLEAGSQTQPAVSRDTSWAVGQAKNKVDAQAAADFPRSFDVKSRPEFVRTSAVDSLGKVLDAVRTASATATGSAGSGNFLAEIEALRSSAGSLILAPSSLASRLQSLVSGLSAASPDRASGYASCRQLLGLTATPATPAATTPSRAQEAANTEALFALARRSALAEAAAATASREFTTYDDARTVRDEMATGLEQEAATASDPVYLSLTDLRVATVRDLNTRGANLARLTVWTPSATLPSLVVAHQVYGDATRADEIVARNRIRHPGAVPGGRVLEVLTRA